MSSSSSPQQTVQVQLGRRFATIPKDQLQILDHNGAWALDPSDRQGVPQIPDHILQGIISYHSMQMRPAREVAHRALSTADDVMPEKESHGLANEDNDDGNGEDKNVGEASSQEEDDGEESVISGWSVSPPRASAKSMPSPQFQSQIVQETPQVDHLDDDVSVSQHSVPQPPRRRSLHHFEPIEEEEDEEEMEVDLPRAHQSSQARVNLVSARMQVTSTPADGIITQTTSNETPSCAQPDQGVIPATVLPKQYAVPCVDGPERRKHRRMQPIQFKGTTPVKRANPSAFERLPTTSRLAEVDSSLSTSSSSLIPATCATNSTQNSITGHALAAQQYTAEHASGLNPLHQSYDTTSHPRPSIENLTLQSKHETPSSKDMYSRFKTAYPSYATSHAGTLKNFIKAMLCLEYLQAERALREFLYDDFIRAFSSGYLGYVRNAGAGREALPAIEWFNLLDGRPEYFQMIINKKNVKEVLEAYSEEVAHARRYISGKSQKEEAPHRETKQLEADERLDVDMHTSQTPEGSPPGTTRADVFGKASQNTKCFALL
ncbi:hypothetical protein EsDP_00005281 [Epichloe bromicola]|uniref:Uncharacterized protein n=1 Tax=Epichloe bromicola TaxID=79588 RepID=A0ABQ0CU83_9HYPO